MEIFFISPFNKETGVTFLKKRKKKKDRNAWVIICCLYDIHIYGVAAATVLLLSYTDMLHDRVVVQNVTQSPVCRDTKNFVILR